MISEVSEAQEEESEAREGKKVPEIKTDSASEAEDSEGSSQSEPAEESTEESEEPAESAVEPDDEDFVRVKDYIPDVEVMLMYATDQNFTGAVIYDFTEAYLRYGTVKKLAEAQEALKELGYKLLIWDAFRPVSAQYVLWEVCPDPRYVANPITGYSLHSCGNTVDLTIITLDGNEVEMPTGFDDFSYRADRDYSDCTEVETINALLLEDVMIDAGFEPYSGEWWHFSDTVDYSVEEEFDPSKEE
ncbi:MAG: M15 family metallopeptidase [Firmicutes bacterium]|nr:M15 family metallopeptidase [Bacillota bacterium]